MTVLTELAQLDSFDRQVGIGADQADHIADFGCGVKAEQQVGSGQFEEVHAVALDDLSHVHQFAQQAGRAGRSLTGQRVAGFGGRQVMADRADPADARGDLRHFKIETSFAEFFKAAKFVDVHIGVVNRAIILHVDGDLGVPFDTGNGFNRNFLCHSTVSTLNASAAVHL